MFFTYILFSDTLNKYYVGHTYDVQERLKRHNAGEGQFTKNGVPWELKYTFECKTRSEAMILENKIKKRGVKRFLQDITVRGVAQPG
ncbi:MAG: GIY-YIG nuclease family protein [Bacteroidota bacterium]|nr:GIY-YIG nuclease family protein [Bacteroidota bacterium]